MKKPLVILLSLVVFLIPTSLALATPIADLTYFEEEVEAGLWRYNYTLHNDSTEGEYLFGVELLFPQFANITGLPLPVGWDDTTWQGTNYSDFLVTFSLNEGYDIAAGASLGGFNFTIDYQAADVLYNAYFDDHQGTIDSISGASAPIPEPSTFVLIFFSLGLFLMYHHGFSNRLIRKKFPNT